MSWFVEIKKYLKNTFYLNWLMRLIPIPLGIVIAKLTANLITEATEGKSRGVLLMGTIILTIVIAMKLFDIIVGTYYQKALSKALHKCKIALYRHFLSNPLYMLFPSKHGDTIEKLNDDFDTVTGKFVSLYPGFCTGIITAIAYFIFIMVQNPFVALSLFGISLLQIVPPVIVKKYMQVNYDNCRDIEAQISNFTIEGCHGFATIKLYHLKQWWLDRLKKLHKEYVAIGSKTEITCFADDAITNLVDNILHYGAYGIIGLFVLFGYTSLDVGIQAIALSGGLFGAVKAVFSYISDFAVFKTAKRRLADWFEHNQDGALEIQGAEICLQDVSHAYDLKMVLDGITITISGDETSVIRGPNGSGKSTLFYLIAGLLQCSAGKITVGGADPVTLKETEFPQKLFFLPQDDAEFNFTAMELYQALLPGHIDIVLKIAEGFQLPKEMIMKTNICELSGGERKKVFLSLAFAINPLIMLLDEPTNSLDRAGRDELKRLLIERVGAAVIITHDEIFDDIADRTYVFNEEGFTVENI